METKLFFAHPSQETANIVTKMLSLAGLRAVRSFDLRSAAALAPDCTCPHHGTNQCDCQYLVFLIYGGQRSVATLAVHGHNGHSWVELTDRPAEHRDAGLEQAILRALAPTGFRATGSADEPARL
jgi:hypothetical protein